MIPFNLGVCLLNTGHNIDAIEAFKIAIQIDDSFGAAWGNLGNAFQAEGQHQEALAATLKSLELNPDNPDALLNLGGIYKDLDQLNEALASTLKSLELKPDNPTAYTNLGIIYKNLGQHNKALASTLKSLELKPDNPTNHMNLGGIYKDLGQLDHALTSTLKSLELNPDNSDALFNLGGIYKGLGQLDRALESTLKSLELKPDNPDGHMNLGSIYTELGKLDEALASTLKSLELKPDNPDGHLNLGGIYKDLDDYTNAEKEVDLAINTNASRLDICHRLKAACLFRKQKYDEAIELLQGLKAKKIYTEASALETEIALRSTIYARKYSFLKLQQPEAATDPKEGEEIKSLVIKRSRPVEKELIEQLHEVDSKSLAHTRDARNGDGYCTNFQLFASELQAIQQLSKDLKSIICESLSMDVPWINQDSFFNVFNKGAGTTPHSHIKIQDKDFDLWKHKYSLVYYLDPGNQDSKYPGILQMYDPDIQILPEKGMVIIIPATRIHSSYYEGSKSRLMVGVNFYAFSTDLT